MNGLAYRGTGTWMTTTIGEVFLLMKEYEHAARLYEAAVAIARSETASH